MNYKSFLPVVMFAVALTACNNEENVPQNEGSRAALGVNVGVIDNAQSRAMIEGTSIPTGSIGVSLVKADGGTYDSGTGMTNVEYSTTDGITWTSLAPISLSSTVGKAIAYFPYNSAVTDYTKIPVDIATQNDYMWSGWEEGVSNAAPKVNFEMNHALTAVKVTLNRDASYSLAGAITALSVKSEGLGSTATMSAVDGSLATVAGANEAISILGAAGANPAITTDSPTLAVPYIFVPAATTAKPFTVALTIDGANYTADVTMTEAFTAGKVYSVTLSLKNENLVVESVVVLEDWINVDLTDGEFKPAA